MRIVGSMTTIPSRIASIERVIDSILNQTENLECLYLNIPKDKNYIIPSFLYKKKNLILNYCDKDYGPITKLIPTLDVEKDDNVYIITFDDDRIVDKNVVKIIRKKISEYPNYALSFSGWCIGSFPFYLECHDKNDKDIEVDWIQGCHTITYPRKLINKNKLLRSFFTGPSFLSKHDDHKISAYLTKNNIKKISIGKDAEKYFISAPCCTTNAISGGNSILGKIKYFTQVIYIVNYFRSLQLYNHSYHNFYKTTTFKLIFYIFFLYICFYIPRYCR